MYVKLSERRLLETVCLTEYVSDQMSFSDYTLGDDLSKSSYTFLATYLTSILFEHLGTNCCDTPNTSNVNPKIKNSKDNCILYLFQI